MNNKPNPPPALERLTTPLTLTLSGSDLEHLNNYREAVFALTLKNWPENAKRGDAPKNYEKHYAKQRDSAAASLAQIFSDAAVAAPHCAVVQEP